MGGVFGVLAKGVMNVAKGLDAGAREAALLVAGGTATTAVQQYNDSHPDLAAVLSAAAPTKLRIGAARGSFLSTGGDARSRRAALGAASSGGGAEEEDDDEEEEEEEGGNNPSTSANGASAPNLPLPPPPLRRCGGAPLA